MDKNLLEASELEERYEIQTLLNRGYQIKDKDGKLVNKLPNFKINYSNFPKDEAAVTNNCWNFWKINKDIAEFIVGQELNNAEYQYEICKNVCALTNHISDLNICENGVLSCCNSKFLSKESIILLIKELNNILNFYDEYFEDFMNKQINKFVENCMEFKRGLSKQKTKKETKINPPTNENEDGYIYVMKNMGYYKIGKACIGSSRFGEYTKLPEEPDYIIKQIVHNYAKVEISLHERYKEKRLREGKCEWFNLTLNDINDIKKFVKKYAR